MPEKSIVRTDRAPAPFRGAPYSQAVIFGDLVFVAGQVALRPGHDEIVSEAIEEQTVQVCENIKTILEEAGSSWEKVLKTTVFLVDFADFPTLNEVYGRYVGERPPARATVEIKSLPMGAKLEVEVVAHR
jgi:2-iminobutanoate/2-iminopropanoate deaminase